MEQMWGNLPAAARFAIPFLLVLVLVGLSAYLWRRLRTATVKPESRRGKRARLAVIDTAVVDARRRLVLIRRDNAEHLLMIGGPIDIVIEPNIGRPEAYAPAREMRVPAPPDRPIRWPQPLETAEPASPASEDWDEARRNQAQPAAPEPIVTLLQELNLELGQQAGHTFRQNQHEEPILPPMSSPASSPEPPFATSAVNAPAMPSVRDIPAPPPDAPAVPIRSAVAPRIFQPVVSSVPGPARPPAPVRREPVIEAPPAPSPAQAEVPLEPPHKPVLPNGRPGALEPKHAAPPVQPADLAPRPALPATSPPVRARPAQDGDAYLAELAQRLEAALRRSTRPAEQQAVVSPTTANPLPPLAARLDPTDTVRRAAAPPPPPTVPGSTPGAADHDKAARAFEGLENEMAKMLERQPGNPPKP